MREPEELTRGRKAYEQRAWLDAYRSFRRAKDFASLGGPDLERLAMSAFFVGDHDEFMSALERAHQSHLDEGDAARAARCAFLLGLMCLVIRGEVGPATGWLGRAQRVLEREPHDCAEHGYLLIPVAEQELRAGQADVAHQTAARAVQIGERFGEVDLVACARHVQGRALIKKRELDRGLALLDEAMVSVTAGELSPLFSGLIYCSVIATCQRVCAFGRAREWTNAMAKWCAEQTQLVTFTGICWVHRAEVLQLHGAWSEAADEIARVTERSDPMTQAAAIYHQGELHRLRGEFEPAEEAYRRASRGGFEPQPGLALLRLAQRRNEAALATIRRVMGTTVDPLDRARLLPAQVEIALANGDVEEASSACAELVQIATTFDTEVLRAMAAEARGAVALAEGDASGALGCLRDALAAWQAIQAPYIVARVRVLIGLACRAAGDADGAELELSAAKQTFQTLGAQADAARVDVSGNDAPAVGPEPTGLTQRELQVLRLVATGVTNKAIAKELHLSEKTIDRHLSNIFVKLDVSSRAAATAYAYEHRLLSS